MAKELPFFKFEPNQWENGNIQMLSREDKGLFIDLCSMYWSRLGDVPSKLAIQKLCGGNATALNSLCDEKIIEVLDGNIFIKFLSEQLNEFEDVSKQNSKNAREGWEKRRKQKEESERNATALIPQCESDAIREEKIREDNNNTPAKADAVFDFDFNRYLETINEKFGRSFKVVNDKTKKQIKARLKETYTKQDIIDAINNCKNSDFHKDNGYRFCTPEFFSRGDILDRWSDVSKPKEKKVNIEL